MSMPPVVSAILAEANRLYYECMKNTDLSDEDSLSWKMTDAYQAFGLKMIDLLDELQSAIDNYVSEISGLSDTNFSPMYLHIQASVPRRSNADWQVVHPNQLNQLSYEGYFQDKGRIHCIGLSGSYHFQSLDMKLKMYTNEYIETRDKTLYSLPIAHSGNPGMIYTNGFPFWQAYNFFSDLTDIKRASHATGKFYYFERYGYTENSKRLQFLVKGEPSDIFHSTAIAWESNTPHESISFEKGQS